MKSEENLSGISKISKPDKQLQNVEYSITFGKGKFNSYTI
jgi:hypothetical protein